MSYSEPRLSASHANPFSLTAVKDYQAWRAEKLAHYPQEVAQITVDIANPAQLSNAEQRAMRLALARANLVIYRCARPLRDKEELRQLGRQFGLLRLDSNLCADEDSITSLQAIETGRQRGYIPYSKQQLSWHTDGYYNAMDKQIRAIVMHCVMPAWQGGENRYLDHEMLYLQLRDANPALVENLMRADVMSIPPNVENGEEIRSETIGPVFSIDDSGHLHMRYSARKRNITWRDDENTRQATSLITQLLENSPYILRYKLQANEGVISNNVLHNRTAFEDDSVNKRLLYRARYYDRVSDIA